MIPHEFDIRDADTIGIVRGLNTGSTAEVQFRPPPTGFNLVSARTLPPLQTDQGSAEIFVHWTVLRSYVLEKRVAGGGPAIIQAFETRVVASRSVELAIRAHLHCRTGLSSDAAQRLTGAFSAFDPDAHGTVTEYVSDFLRKNNDISENDFVLAYSYIVKAQGDTEDSDSEFINSRLQLPGGDEQYQIRRIDPPRFIDDVVPSIQHPNEREVQRGESHDPAIEEVAHRNQPRGCDGMVVTKKAFARTDFLPETRTRWSRKKLKIGRCWTWIPWLITEKRDTELVAYFYAQYPGNIGQYAETIIKDCAERAAREASVIAIVFVDINAFIPAFKALFARCIEQRFGEMIHCLEASVVIVKELQNPPQGEWH